ncbi:UNVERIFIED_ORG: flavin reductase (DIM6/NTAB) family NADH-FMN oxidoreductase RutF [Gordonia westfalica J30]
MIDPSTFREIMAAAPGPAAVVTATGTTSGHQGLTMTAVCSVSLTPPMLLVCLDHNSNTLAAIRESGSFTVNYIAEGHDDVALRFATKTATKFDGIDIAEAADIGGPVLTEYAAAHAVCQTATLVDAGDHTVVVGSVVAGRVHGDRQVLAYAKRTFFTAASQS